MQQPDVLTPVCAERYVSSLSGRVLERGKSGETDPVGRPLSGQWVLRTSRGSYLDHNRHPQDLANAHGLQLQNRMEAELA